ncbi:MAG: alpha-keto acid decarboxylase family protein [Planctomycetaceae bacterium]|nr:alpha-keto acid decarboxylase family protein [Planctomycetaceae bacterium]
MARKTARKELAPTPKRAAKRTAGGRNRKSPSSESKSNGRTQTIGRYLIERLQHYGVGDVFGIPGDFVLHFYGMLEESPIRVIGCTREDNAGYAADAYARVNGLGAVCVTYCVGGLSLCNSIAGAYAEKSPVVVISGAPGIAERQNDPLLHHRVRDFNTQRDVFEKITVAGACLDDPLTAFREIDRVLQAAVRYKRPVYLEVPRDRVDTPALYPHEPMITRLQSSTDALAASLAEATERIQSARQPVIIAGVEIHRFGLRDPVLKLAEANNIPMCATLLGKSVVSEKHPLYLGVYEGAMGRRSVTEFVESSDCVVLLGTFMTDINLGIFTAHLDPGCCIYATSEKLRIGHHHFHDVLLGDFVKGLAKARLKPKSKASLPQRKERVAGTYEDDDPVTIAALFDHINATLGDNMVVVADVGDSLFAASDLTIHKHTEFISPAYYTSMGFAIPACIGVQTANAKLRPIVLVGDGAFQMTCLELSTAVRHGYNPIVVVLNNKGYTTERFLQDGPFNDILNWNYHRMPDLLGDGWGFEVNTVGELHQSMKAALANEDTFTLLNVHLRPDDISPALERLANRLSKQV